MEVAGTKIRQLESKNRDFEARPHAGLPAVHPAWQALIRMCCEMGHGEIECIKIQDGLPVSAEVVRKKIRWL